MVRPPPAIRTGSPNLEDVPLEGVKADESLEELKPDGCLDNLSGDDLSNEESMPRSEVEPGIGYLLPVSER